MKSVAISLGKNTAQAPRVLEQCPLWQVILFERKLLPVTKWARQLERREAFHVAGLSPAKKAKCVWSALDTINILVSLEQRVSVFE